MNTTVWKVGDEAIYVAPPDSGGLRERRKVEVLEVIGCPDGGQLVRIASTDWDGRWVNDYDLLPVERLAEQPF